MANVSYNNTSYIVHNIADVSYIHDASAAPGGGLRQTSKAPPFQLREYLLV